MHLNASPLRLACDFCGRDFCRRHRAGRIPTYCSRTCRQRAYEHRRRGAQWPEQPDPPQLHRQPAYEPPAFYEGAVTMRGKCVRHAIRPYVPPDYAGMRTTLCGTRARVGKAPFMPHEWAACRNCEKVAKRFPPAKRVDSSDDLAYLLADFVRLRERAARASELGDVRELLDGIWATALRYTGIGDQRLASSLRPAA